MIKNNLIITEEERERILNLVRLPNYKKPKSIREQAWPAKHVPLNKEKEQKVQAQSTVDYLVTKMGLDKTYSIYQPQEIIDLNNQILDRVNSGYRSIYFSYFEPLVNALKEANPTRANVYDTQLKTFKDGIAQATNTWKTSVNNNHNPLSNPRTEDVDQYTQVSLNANYGTGMFLSDIKGWVPKKGPQNVDVTKEVEFLGCAECNKVTTNYVNSMRNDLLSDTQLEEQKKQLKLCWTSIEYTGEKNILGRYKKGKACQNKPESRQIYRRYVEPLLSTDPNAEIDGVRIPEKYKLKFD